MRTGKRDRRVWIESRKRKNKTRISDERFLLVHSSAGGHIRIVIDVAVVVVVVDDVHVLMIGSSNKRIHAMHGITKEKKNKTTTQRDIFFIYSLQFRFVALRVRSAFSLHQQQQHRQSASATTESTREKWFCLFWQKERDDRMQATQNYIFPNVNRFLLLLDAHQFHLSHSLLHRINLVFIVVVVVVVLTKYDPFVSRDPEPLGITPLQTSIIRCDARLIYWFIVAAFASCRWNGMSREWYHLQHLGYLFSMNFWGKHWNPSAESSHWERKYYFCHLTRFIWRWAKSPEWKQE